MGGGNKTLPVVPPPTVAINQAIDKARASKPPVIDVGARVAAGTAAANRVRKMNAGSGRTGSVYTPPPVPGAIPSVKKGTY